MGAHMWRPERGYRTWTLASEQVCQKGIVNVVSRTIQGALRHAVEAFIQAQAGPREDVAWIDIHREVMRHFLSTDEAAALRDVVEGQLTQDPHEAVNAYARRYQEAAARAYPVPKRNEDQHRLLVRHFLGGLREPEIACTVVRTGDPRTLDDAVLQVANICAREESIQRLTRSRQLRAEPMEVDAVKPAAEDPWKVKMETALTALTDAVTQLSAGRDRRPRNREGGRRPRNENWDAPTTPDARRPWNRDWNADGRPRCFACGRFGHIARECEPQQRRPRVLPSNSLN